MAGANADVVPAQARGNDLGANILSPPLSAGKDGVDIDDGDDDMGEVIGERLALTPSRRVHILTPLGREQGNPDGDGDEWEFGRKVRYDYAESDSGDSMQEVEGLNEGPSNLTQATAAGQFIRIPNGTIV